MQKMFGCAVLVCVCALVTAETGSVQKRDTEYAQEENQDYYNNYYNYQDAGRPTQRRKAINPFGWLNQLFGRRSSSSGHSGGSSYSSQEPSYKPAAKPSGGGFPALGDILVPLMLLCAGLVLGLLAFSALSAALNSSGRGLDTDEWEVDHSVWMDQLQRDFENSWSTE